MASRDAQVRFVLNVDGYQDALDYMRGSTYFIAVWPGLCPHEAD